jgi:hypothetical protein
MAEKETTAVVTDLANFRVKKPELVWECNCGGQHFYLNLDGTIQCRSCKLIRETIEWGYRAG